MSIDGNVFKEFGVRQCTVVGVSDDEKALMVKFDSEAVHSTSPMRAIIAPIIFGQDRGMCLNLASLKDLKAFGCRVTNTDEFLILGFKQPRFQEICDVQVDAESNIRAGTSKLPTANNDEVILSGMDADLKLDLGGFSLSKPDDSGIFLNNINNDNFTKSSFKLYSHFYENTTAASLVRHGEVYRFPNGASSLTIEDTPKNDLGGSKVLEGNLRGLFYGNLGLDESIGSKPRNIPLTEYREVICEFPSYAAFDGFRKEAKLTFSDKALDAIMQKQDKIREENDDKGVLFLGKNQLIETMKGNVIDRYGSSLDINYMQLSYGGPLGCVPKGDETKKFEEARCITRRGIGYHVMLSTNTESDDDGPNSNNFTYALDKEGMLKVSIPKSSDTGNIPYSSKTNTNEIGRGRTKLEIESKEEEIPVTLRGNDGERVYPKRVYRDNGKRDTGIRYSNQWGYFPSDSSYVRVSPTKHHNMYAAAEMLIANTIDKIFIPSSSTDPETGITSGTQSKLISFEQPRKPIKPEDGKSESFPTHSPCATVVIHQGKPAIKTGGGTVVCGTNYERDENRADGIINNPLGNNFSVKESDEVSVNIEDSARPTIPAGGKSAHINLEGSLEMSVGSDSADNKSIVLDTAGSLIAWLGKDDKERSAVIQTDGAVAVNIGGMNGNTWNKGRFDLRVNVTDKGVMSTTNPLLSFAKEEVVGTDSDYIISISSEGLVIAGTSGSNMVIRNKGDLLLESTKTLLLSGTQVMVREGGLPDRPVGKDTVSKNTPTANTAGLTKTLLSAKNRV